MLEIRNVRKAFGSLEVLKGVDLRVEQGDVAAILGPSGSGKTTLLRCINFLETAGGGTMTFDGEDFRLDRTPEKVGMAGREDHYPHQLSGGQQQRAAIARAIAANPKIIFFDEPTSALDPELTGEVLSVMRQLAEEGMTMLVVTHEMGFARTVSNKVIFMEDGAVVEEAPSGEFFRNPREERTRAFLRTIRAAELAE